MSVQPTIVSYPGNGAQTLFTFQFDYISSDYVKVRVNGVDTPFTFNGSKAIQLSTAPEAGTTVVIARETDRERLVDFTDGSVLIEEDLDLADTQLLHIVQEAIDISGTTLGLLADGSLTASGRRIGSIGDPVNAQDVVSKNWAETSMSSQLVQATTQAGISTSAAATAVTARDAAQASATAAAASATTAGNSETVAVASANAAQASASTASAAASAAGTSQAAAALSETNSLANRTASEASAAEAAASAELARGVAPGFISMFGGNTAPAGWLSCAGQLVSRSTYAALFSAIGTIHGAGDGSTTFQLPDMRAEFPRGWDGGRGIDPTMTVGNKQLDQMQRITGTISGGRTVSVGTSTGALETSYQAGATGSAANGGGTTSDGTIRFDSANSPDARVSATTAGETRPRFVALMFCIKT